MASLLSVILVVCLVPLVTHGQQTSDQPKSYLQETSFSAYPPWAVTDEGLLQLSFKTPQLNGMILYIGRPADPVAFGELLNVRLANGALELQFFSMEFTIETPARLGANLNDNQVHRLSITHHATTNQFTVLLDDTLSTTVQYHPHSTGETDPIFGSPVFIGGIDPNYLSLPLEVDDPQNQPTFTGCVMELRYSANSTNEGDLVAESPLTEVAVTDGCVDPCDGVSCGSGICLPRFPVGTCDCQGTGLLGPNCDQDADMFSVAFNGSNSTCFNARQEPFANEIKTATATLLPPYPQSGTFMSGFSNSGFSYYMSIDEGEFTCSITRNNGMIGQDSYRFDPMTEYQIDLQLADRMFNFTVSENRNGTLTTLYTNQNPIIVSFVTVDFERVCIGGVSLELGPYRGTIVSAMANHYSLTEEIESSSLQPTEVQQSNVLNINTPGPFIEFNSMHLDSSRISFDVRQEQGTDTRSEIIQFQNDSGDVVYLAFINSMVTNQLLDQGLCSVDIGTNLWVHFEIIIEREPVPRITYTVNCEIQCVLLSGVTLQELDEYLSNPIRFGTGSTASTPEPFTGCYQNIVFEDSSGNERIPNLEALGQADNGVSNTGCYDCLEGLACGNDEECVYRDYTGLECLVDRPNFSPLNLCSFDPTLPPSNSTPPPVPDTTTPRPPDPVTLETGAIVGIALGALILVLLLLLFTILLVYCCWRSSSGQGFYRTYETNDNETPVVHYSASLKELSEEVVTNGHLPAGSVSNGKHSKEFYL